MTSETKTWESLKAKYLREVEKVLSSVKHPRIRDVLSDVRSHLDQRFAELEPGQETVENFRRIITEMGPACDYAELLDPGAGRPARRVRLRYVVGSAAAAVLAIVGGILLIVRMSGPPRPVTTEEFRRGFQEKADKFKIDTATLEDVRKIFGEPSEYVWGEQVFDRENLPRRYVAFYPDGFHVFVADNRVIEVRHEGPGTGYAWRGKLQVGSSLEEVLEVVGQPAETVEGEPIGFKDGVLYKDINGRKGHCYYARIDQRVRFFFGDYRVAGLYVTRSDFGTGGGRSSNVRKAPAPRPRRQGKRIDYHYTPTKDAGPIEWKDNKIVSRVLPYPDLISLFIRLPIAHALATGKGVKVAVIRQSDGDAASSMVKRIAPGADVETYAFESGGSSGVELARSVSGAGCRVAVIPDVHVWSEESVVELTKQLLDDGVFVVVPSDLSEDKDKIKAVDTLHGMGALTVGRVDRQSLVMEGRGEGRRPFNRHIRKIKTDLFSTVGLEPYDDSMNPAASAAGVAGLVLEKWAALTPREVRRKMVTGARDAWQLTSIETGQVDPHVVVVDPVTTEYKVRDESKVFRFCVLDAAGSLDVDTEIPWFLNMLNCHKAWEITKGTGVVAVVSDQGFHVRHPELAGRIEATEHFGPRTFDARNQNFHGTDMARILLAVAPEAGIIPVLCSNPRWEGYEEKIAKSFLYAAEQKADIITASWSGRFNKNAELLGAVRNTVDSGVVVSWFHFPQAYPGLLRSRFTYWTWAQEPCLGFADRLLTDRPGFHPVEIEAGLSGTAPQAAGIAALAKSVNRELSPKEIKELIFNNSTPIGSGVMVPDAHRIVLAARGG
ncbi:MAG: S8 family serine peptidase [Planctomycetota bacterium]|jgi:subtilisin family serine protease